MDKLILESLNKFVDKANEILNGNIVSAYCHGSCIYDDFHSGYSDLDFFIISRVSITERHFEEFSLLRTQYKNSRHPHFSVLEGEVICMDAIKRDIESTVIYWGTSGDRIKNRYGLSGFSLKGLIDNGYLVFGEDIRKELPYPSKEEMLSQVNLLIETIRKHAQVTNEDIHSMDWLFLISQSIYWLKASGVQGKTNAARWVLNNCCYNWRNDLQRSIDVRKSPILGQTDENREWLKNLGNTVQRACDSLVQERDEYIEQNNLTRCASLT